MIRGCWSACKHVANSDFARVTYTDAVEMLKKNNDKFEYKVEWGVDLQTEHEKYLTEQIFGKPVFRDGLSEGDQGVLYAP